MNLIDLSLNLRNGSLYDGGGCIATHSLMPDENRLEIPFSALVCHLNCSRSPNRLHLNQCRGRFPQLGHSRCRLVMVHRVHFENYHRFQSGFPAPLPLHVLDPHLTEKTFLKFRILFAFRGGGSFCFSPREPFLFPRYKPPFTVLTKQKAMIKGTTNA